MKQVWGTDSQPSSFPCHYEPKNQRTDEQAQAKRCKRNVDIISLDTHPNVERYTVTPEAGTEEKTMNHIQNKALHQAL